MYARDPAQSGAPAGPVGGFRPERQNQTHFALPAVQIELVLTDGHRPHSFDQRVAGIPGVDHLTRLTERPLGCCSPVDTHTHTCLEDTLHTEFN